MSIVDYAVATPTLPIAPGRPLIITVGGIAGR